jgi:hypothetical protein
MVMARGGGVAAALLATLASGQFGCQEDKTCRGVIAIGGQYQTAALLKADGSAWFWQPGFADTTKKFKALDAVGFANAQLCFRYSGGYVACEPSLVGATASQLVVVPNPREVSTWYDSLLGMGGSNCAVTQDDALTCMLEYSGEFSERAQGIGNVGVGAGHFCAMTLQGSVLCQADIGAEPTWSSAAADLTGVVEVVSLAESRASVVRTAAGALWSLHEPQTADEPVGAISEVPIVGVGGPVSQLVAGESFACALRSDGAVFCWADGGNRDRAGVVLQVNHPQNRVVYQITSLPQPAVALAGLDLSVCALLRDTTVWCWGIVGGDHQNGSPKGGRMETCD